MAKTATKPQKPLFVPLNSEHYDNFRSGLKTFEFRQGPKRWNDKTVYTGREVIISKGYGKKNRMIGTIGLVVKSYYSTSILEHKHNGEMLWKSIFPFQVYFNEACNRVIEIYPTRGKFIAFECLGLKEIENA